MISTSNDTILLQMESDAFEAVVSETLKLIREGDLLAISTLSLAHSSLIADNFLAGEAISSDARGRAMQSLMRWAVDRLRPAGEHSWLTTAWRGFNILNYFYLEGMRASELAEAMAISEQTLYHSRPQAIANVALILKEELASSSHKVHRQRYVLTDRYARHTPAEQRLLRMMAVFSHSIPVQLVYQMVDNANLKELQENIHHLVGSNLVLVSDAGTEVALRAEMRTFLLTLLTPEERTQLHRLASLHYTERQDYLEAARQQRLANDWEQAAETIIQNYKKVIDNLQIEELAGLVAEFQQAELSAYSWARLKIVSGEIAELSEQTQTALSEYQQALAAPEIDTKAVAYYRRAKVFERQNVGESLAHYGYAIRLLESLANQEPSSAARTQHSQLLVQMHIDRAWLYIQVQPDADKAASDLLRAHSLIDEHNRILWADLHNAFGRFYLNQNDLEKSVQNYWEAWLAANEVQDVTRMANTAHNLGSTLSEQGHYEQAINYLQQSLHLSIQSNNRQIEGLCHLSIGACYYWQDRFDEAISEYQLAQAIFERTGNRTLLLRAHFNLAEAHGKICNFAEMRRFFYRGYSDAQNLKDEYIIRDFLELMNIYPMLRNVEEYDQLNSRQQQVLKYLEEHRQITNREYQELTQISQKQAVRDLNELLKIGLVVRLGKGRATHYVLKLNAGSSI